MCMCACVFICIRAVGEKQSGVEMQDRESCRIGGWDKRVEGKRGLKRERIRWCGVHCCFFVLFGGLLLDQAV